MSRRGAATRRLDSRRRGAWGCTLRDLEWIAHALAQLAANHAISITRERTVGAGKAVVPIGGGGPAGTAAPRPAPKFDPEAEYSDDYSAWHRRTQGVKEDSNDIVEVHRKLNRD